MKFNKTAILTGLLVCVLLFSSCTEAEKEPVKNAEMAYTDPVSEAELAQILKKAEEDNCASVAAIDSVADKTDDSADSETAEKDPVVEIIMGGVHSGNAFSEGEEVERAAISENEIDDGEYATGTPDFNSMPEDVQDAENEEDDYTEIDFSGLGEADSESGDDVEAEIEGFEYFVKIYRTDLKAYFNVPLSYDLQLYTYKMSVKYNVPYRVVMGLFGLESTWNKDVGIHNGYVGLGMLSERYAATYFANMGIDIYTPKGNIEATCYVLSDKLASFDGNVSYALMAYNLGTGGARTKIKKGIFSTGYSRRIIDFSVSLLTQEQYNEIKNK